MKVGALSSGKNVPSARFRVRQYIVPLAKEGIEVIELYSKIDKYSPPSEWMRQLALKDWKRASRFMFQLKKFYKKPLVKKASTFDIVWLERTLVETKLTYELNIKKPMVFDLDDAIWLLEGKGFTDKIASRADHIFAGNSFLADWCKKYNNNVSVIPTAVDTEKYFPVERKNEKKIIFGWIGTSSNYRFLQTIFPVIHEILALYPQVEFHVCSELRPDFNSDQFNFIQWNPEMEIDFLQSLDFGLMPLNDDEWSRGKCSLKMLQYMAMGIPAIVSPYGMNAELLSQWNSDFGASSLSEWKEKIIVLIENEKLRTESGITARKLMVEKYDVKIIASTIASHFKKLI